MDGSLWAALTGIVTWLNPLRMIVLRRVESLTVHPRSCIAILSMWIVIVGSTPIIQMRIWTASVDRCRGLPLLLWSCSRVPVSLSLFAALTIVDLLMQKSYIRLDWVNKQVVTIITLKSLPLESRWSEIHIAAAVRELQLWSLRGYDDCPLQNVVAEDGGWNWNVGIGRVVSMIVNIDKER